MNRLPTLSAGSLRGHPDTASTQGSRPLRKTLTSTNPIESMFSTVRDCEGNIKRYRNSAMSQRWLATVLLHCEKGFRRVKGYLSIAEVMATIDQIQEEKYVLQKAA